MNGSSRDVILGRIREGLGREMPSAVESPEVRLRPAASEREDRIAMMLDRLEAVGGDAVRVPDLAAVRDYVARVTGGADTVASNSPYLETSGITGLPGILTGFGTEAAVREACAAARFGVTAADYALADTGTLVLLASSEARLISLLPPVHIAVLAADRLLGGLDDLFALVPKPADLSSSMVFVTGPSRTGDI